MEDRTVVDFRSLPFVRVTKAVIDEDNVLNSPTDIAVYTVLCMYADNDTTESNPKVKTIAKKARCSESSAHRALRNLRDAGYIEIRPRFRGDGGRTSSQYVLVNVEG